MGQHHDIAIIELLDAPEERTRDGARLVQLRAYRWTGRRRGWDWQAWMKALWVPSIGQLAIGDLEVIRAQHRSKGVGTILLLETLRLADRLGAAEITGQDIYPVPMTSHALKSGTSAMASPWDRQHNPGWSAASTSIAGGRTEGP